MEDNVILVDSDDHEIGIMGKMEAHRLGLLHRAFSVVVFNSRNELLLQQRALTKYHSGGLWTNTCCSHPRPGEQIEEAARRRLNEEMGMQCSLTHFSSFIYKAELDNALTEHEYDHIFIGFTDDVPHPHIEEVMAFRYVSPAELQEEMHRDPQNYTAWFHLLFPEIHRFIQQS